MKARGSLCSRGLACSAFLCVLTLQLTPAYGQACTSDAQCNDNLFCTLDICFPPGGAGNCIHPENSCSDGQFCNGQEICDETRNLCEVACVGGTTCNGAGFCVCPVPGTCPNGNGGAACDNFVQPPNCSPGTICNETLNQCTQCFQNSHCTTAPELRCDTATGECVECTLDTHCDDNAFCNGEETCNTGTGFCEEGSTVQCSFGEFCSELLDRCVECENDVQCSDGLYCNGTETCVNDQCQNGTAVNCPVLDPSKPFCKEASDTCVACLTDAHCNDNKFCTSDACVFNECSSTPDPLRFCDDGVFCNGAEDCNAANTACVAGPLPPCGKTCFQGLNDGDPCTSDAQCGKACKEGPRAGMTCNVDADCTTICAGGLNNADPCAADNECESNNCTSVGLCATGVCRGGCSESVNDCVQCAADVSGSTSCSDNLFCTGAELCSGAHECVAAPRQFCENLNTDCTKGVCNESTDLCTAGNRLNGTICDDDNHCTRQDECQAGVCVEDPPLATDPYRCVKLDLLPITTGTIVVGQTVEVKLQATAQNCNITYPVGQPVLCPAATQHPISGVSAILDWDPTKLQLQTSTIGNLNPQDPCDNGNPCFACPTDQYNWASSLFSFDCDNDALNAPCSGTPANDGDAFYLATSQLQCSGQPKPACVTPTGLYVTKFKFTVLAGASGGTASVSLATCAGEQSKTQVVSSKQAPNACVGGTNDGAQCTTNANCPGGGSCLAGLSQDVTKSIGSTANFSVVACTTNGQCTDGNNCTDDFCVNGMCRNTVRTCIDADPCTVDSCNPNNGACSNVPINCGAGNRCYQAACYQICSTAAQCNDGVACSVDTCQDVDSGSDICIHTANNAACATGQFCAAQVCNVTLGCVFDHNCFSNNGNPCPNNASCNEANDNCGGCLVPAVTPTGSRYLTVVPASQGATTLALLVEGDCNTPGVECVSKYIQSRCNGGPNNGLTCASQSDCPKVCVGGPHPGTTCATSFDCGIGGVCAGTCEKGRLGDSPVFLTAAQWGEVDVTGLLIRPDSLYRVMTDCNFAGGRVLSAGTPVKTRRWGDTDGNGVVNVIDVAVVSNAIKELWSQATFEGTNVYPCDVDGVTNVIDLGVTVDALKGIAFPCTAICP